MAQQITISAEQEQALRKALQGVQPMGAVETFCDNWANAKSALDMLRNLIALVPAIGMFAGPAISVVIAAGDAAKSAMCNK